MVSRTNNTSDNATITEKSKPSSGIRSYLPPRYVYYVTFVSLGGWLFGFDTGSIGPVTVLPQFTKTFGDVSPTIHGLLVSLILITACISSLFAGVLSDRISRTRAVSIGAVVFAIGSALEAVAAPTASSSPKSGLATFMVGRLIAGAGEGLFLTPLTVYTLEVAPTKVRGQITCIIQVVLSCGLTTGFFVTYGTLNIPSSLAWRVPYIMQAIVAIILAVGAFALPESPRYLLHIGRAEKAREIVHQLGGWDQEEWEADITEDTKRRALRTSEGVNKPHFDGWKNGWGMLEKGSKRRVGLALFMMATQQSAGIDGVLYYAPTLFTQAGLSSKSASFLASGVTGLLSIFCAITGMILTERWGRRPLYLTGGVFLSASMLIIGFIYSSSGNDSADLSPAAQRTIIAMIYIFVISFCTSWACVIRIYIAEIQPTNTRAVVNALGTTVNWIVNWIIAFTTPIFLAKSNFGPYLMFGFSALISVVVGWLFMPETKGQSFESLNHAFDDMSIASKFRGLRLRRSKK